MLTAPRLDIMSGFLIHLAPMGVSSALARHCSEVAFEDVPRRAVDAAKRSLLDALGVSLAASTLAPECLPFVELARYEQAGGPCTILGFGERTAPLAAALANGALAHALDFEDAHDTALVHPNAPVVPVVLALAESDSSIDGARLLTAMAVGCDVTCRLSLAAGRRLHERGWYPPSLLAGIGATAAGANLLRLDERRTLDAFSLAIGQLGSHGQLMHSPESVVRSVRDAFPAHAALVAALLARRGVRGYDEPLEGTAGLFAVYVGEEPDEEVLLTGLGETYAGEEISFKPWPSCRGTHPFVEAALSLVREHGLRSAEIDRVRLVASPTVGSIVAEPRERKLRPRSVIDAKFSAFFTTALAFEDGRVTLDGFTAERLRDPALLRLADRIEFEADPSYHVSGGALTVETTAGAVLGREIEELAGSPSKPLSDDDLVTKFLDCAGHAASPLQASDGRRLADVVQRLEEVSHVGRELFRQP
jgi:2-methylcitrate dehydratase PrpD